LGNHPPFQIDGNFGVTAGIAEMLLQSHHGEIHLLPALPNRWSEGEVQGLVARGGFIVDITWQDGLLMQARVTSTHGQRCTIYYEHQILIIKPDGMIMDAEGPFDTRIGEIYIITSK
jgi:alpha-L-fucosidase 2